MRFLANENLPRAAVEGLRAAGHDVAWIRIEAPGASDEQVLARSRDEARVLITLDKDFGELVLRRGLGASQGVVLLRLPLASPDDFAARAVWTADHPTPRSPYPPGTEGPARPCGRAGPRCRT